MCVYFCVFGMEKKWCEWEKYMCETGLQQDSLFQGQCDISAEQWSPMVVVGDAHVTEMLTPSVMLTQHAADTSVSLVLKAQAINLIMYV